MHVNDSEIEISIPKQHTVIIGDKVKCILEDSSFKEAIVSSIINDTTFRVKRWEEFKLRIGDELFVYGKLVKNFLRVDKIRLGVLALAGVKELNTIIEKQQEMINKLMTTVTKQQEMINELSATVTKQQEMINELSAKIDKV